MLLQIFFESDSHLCTLINVFLKSARERGGVITTLLIMRHEASPTSHLVMTEHGLMVEHYCPVRHCRELKSVVYTTTC